MRLVIQGDPCLELAPNRRLGRHWAASAFAKETAKTAALVAWREAGEPGFAGAVTIRFTIHRGRVLDPDNALSALKVTLDSLKGRLFPDDSARYVEYLPVRFATGRRFGGAAAHVVCEIWEREPLPERYFHFRCGACRARVSLFADNAAAAKERITSTAGMARPWRQAGEGWRCGGHG